MANIINISEKGNRLFIEDTYTPIVCGNSNYKLVFNFSEEWQSCHSKTAMFMVDSKRTLVAFEGNTCTVPVLPNGLYVFISLLSSSSSGEQLATTRLRLRLEPNPFNEPYSEDESKKRYTSEIHGCINDIKNGTVIVNHAEQADTAILANSANCAETAGYATTAGSSETQVDLTSNQTIQGTKDFSGSILKSGMVVPNIAEISNPNLLINGDFKINQRGNTSYSTQNQYTLDRWKLVDGSLSVEENGITLNGTISQTLEHTPTQAVTLSVDQSNGTVNATYNSGVVTLSASNVLISWVKLEYGSFATKFTPRLYAEELALCQRFYQTLSGHYCVFTNAGTTEHIRFSLNLITPIRSDNPLITWDTSGCYLFGNSKHYDIKNNVTLSINYVKDNAIDVAGRVNATLSSSNTYILASLSSIIDAEIY